MSHEELSIKIKAKQATKSSWAAINKLIKGLKLTSKTESLLLLGLL